MSITQLQYPRLSLKSAESVRGFFARKLVSNERMTITPELATAILEHCQGVNRNVSDVTVAKYASDMKHGKWRVTHQGVAFDKSGRLLDGQHRMWAIVNSGESVEMWVAFGLDTDAMLSIDQNRSRTVADVFAIKGKSQAQRFVASVRGIAIITCEPNPGSYDRVQQMYMQFKSGLDFALALNLPGSSAVNSAFAFAHKTDPAGVARFAERYKTGLNIDSENDPAHTLREFVLVNRGAAVASGGRRVMSISKRDAALKILRCIAGGLHNELMPRLQPSTEAARYFARAWGIKEIDGQRCDVRTALEQRWKDPTSTKR